MQEHDFVRVAYTGKVKETGQHLHSEEDAPIIVGANWVIKGIDEALKELNVGEEKEFDVPPEKAFGERDTKFVKIVPEAEFKRHGQKPVPGMTINADNMIGRVLSVSSGRITIDFNHPLAGKHLIFKVKIKEKIEKLEEKIMAVMIFHGRVPKEKIHIHVKEKETEIELPPFVIDPLFRKKAADDIIKYIGMDKVKYLEVFEKPKE